MQCPMISQNCILVLHCSYCSFNTLLLSNLINHFKTAHSSANCLFSLYQCRHCQLISTSCPVLTEHSLINHIEKEVSIQCIYQNHSGNPIFTGEAMYECLLCSFKAKEVKNLTLHYFAFHGIKNASPNLTKHLTYDYSSGLNYNFHDAKSLFMGDKRNAFVDLNQDDGEMSSHSVGTESGRFSRGSHLSSSQVNRSLMPYKCTHCGNAYHKRKYFAEHVFSCSKSLQLTCPCGRVCKWRSNFYAHRKSCAVYKQLVTGGSHLSVFRRRGLTLSKSSINDDSESITKESVSSSEHLLDMSTNPKDASTVNLIGGNDLTSLVSSSSTPEVTPQSNPDSSIDVFGNHSDSLQTSLTYITPVSSLATSVPTFVSNENIETNNLNHVSSNSMVTSASIIHALSQTSNLSVLVDTRCPVSNYPSNQINECTATNAEGGFIQCVSSKGEPLIMFPDTAF
ncbi:hypothetical protein MS3_00010694 [Schistosoma haematobium]|uniref:C2H2-type domain-containing protein n=1 Tax=Schistosoma haematobium TaxID=6185 RepID=A0A922LDX1_SCHHA|nr:uncharacterized protein MS3_00010694 [Schistosoma haematobium]KAH9578523.1 hypothetical protein MS3_00010694 [Schistosoma haematobium]